MHSSCPTTRTFVLSSSASEARSRSSSAMRSWPSSARRSRTRTTPSEPSAQRLAIRDWLAEPDRPQQARIAVSTGEAHVTVGAVGTEGEPLAVGDVVNTAARLQAAAPVNGVLVGEQTFRATRHAIEYRESEPVTAKGKSAPIRVWEAIGVLAQPGIDPSRHHSPFIGREHELAALEERCRAGRLRALAAVREDPGRPRHRQDAPRLGVAAKTCRSR